MSTVIKVENLSKYYRLGLIGGKTLHDDLNRWWARVRKQPDPLLKIGQEERQNGNGEYIWALRDINFEVQQGEIVGIIGRNGAGKSTLLKILSRITAPTSGQIKVKGRIASLLEVGTGFHPELTGRENIYLNGAILGMKKAEIDRKFDEIVAFAEVEKFIDTPVKRYSSGMYVRLAFAVAAHLEPEILVVDEVLAVGDAAFQKKCLGKMGDVAKEGRTVLFVSHNMTAIRSLCGKAVLLRAGIVTNSGGVNSVVNQYLAVDQREILEQSWNTPDGAPGNDAIRVRSVRVVPAIKADHGLITVETPLDIYFEFWNLHLATIYLSMHVQNVSGETIFAAISPVVDIGVAIAKFVCHIPANFMNDGYYSITMLVIKDSKSLFTLNDAVVFEVHDVERTGNWWGKWPGAVRPKFVWQHDLINIS